MSETSQWRIDVRLALSAAALCWAGLVLVMLLVESGHSAEFDAAGLRFWRSAPHAPWLAAVMIGLTELGGFVGRNLIIVAVMIALARLKRRREAALLAITTIAGSAVVALLKLAIDRPRPDIVPHLVVVNDSSFPSGHSFNSAVTYIAIALAFAALIASPALRRLLVVAAMTLSALIAFSRVWLGVHFPSDVLAGWLGGAGWALLAAVFFEWRRALIR